MPRSDRDLARIRNRLGENIPVPAPRRRDNEESRMQCALISWWAGACAGFGVAEHLLFSIPNGGRRDPVTGAILKREGSRRGASDLFLAVPEGFRSGAFIEMKAPGGRLSPEQTAFLDSVFKRGYAIFTAYSVKDAVDFITEYLKAP